MQFKLIAAEEEDPQEWKLVDPRVTTLIEGRVGDDGIGFELEDCPDWLDFELCEVGADCVFLYTKTWEEMLLLEGLCPGQRVSCVWARPTTLALAKRGGFVSL